MNLKDTLTRISSALKSENISHAVIGGFALASHGVARTTIDIDLLVDGSKKDLVRNAAINAGFSVVFESAEVLQLSGAGQVDILFANRQSTLSMLGRAKNSNHFPVPVATAEDIVGLKIQAYVNDPSRIFQDKADIQSLFKANPQLDFQKIKEYADLFGEWTSVQEIKAKI